MKEHREANLGSRIFIAFTVLVIASAFRITVALGQVSSSASLQPAGNPKTTETISAVSQPPLPACPVQGVATLQASATKPGHHKVTLSWKASAPSVKPEAKAVGYCLYRSKSRSSVTQYLTKQIRKCANCELVNATAFDGTTCVDDLVQDGATYYYVVTAVNVHGNPSSPSNETPAEIPDKASVGSSAVVSHPWCRAATGSR